MDTLSLLLSMANVSSHSDVLVVDMIGGLLAGAVAERLGGNGYVCNTYCGSTPYSIDIVRMFNFGNEICERILHSSLTDLCSSSDVSMLSNDQLEDVFDNRSQSNEKVPSPPVCSLGTEETISEGGSTEIIPETAASPVCKHGKAAKADQKAPLEATKSWRENGFSSLIVAAPFVDAWSIVKEVFPLLSFSAPFVVYHQYLLPLAQCMHNLQVGKMALAYKYLGPGSVNISCV